MPPLVHVCAPPLVHVCVRVPCGGPRHGMACHAACTHAHTVRACHVNYIIPSPHITPCCAMTTFPMQGGHVQGQQGQRGKPQVGIRRAQPLHHGDDVWLPKIVSIPQPSQYPRVCLHTRTLLCLRTSPSAALPPSALHTSTSNSCALPFVPVQHHRCLGRSGEGSKPRPSVTQQGPGGSRCF